MLAISVLDQVERGSGPYRFAYIQRDPFYPPEVSAWGSLLISAPYLKPRASPCWRNQASAAV